jgi:hypothetical protein
MRVNGRVPRMEKKSINDLVCEQVMKWKAYGDKWLDGHGEVMKNAFTPATNLEHAHEVVAWMRKIGWEFSKTELEGGLVRATFTWDQLKDAATEESEALAICIAALNAEGETRIRSGAYWEKV